MPTEHDMPGLIPRGLAGFVTFAIPLAFVAVLMGAIAGPGYGFGWWHYGTSFTLMRWAEWIAYAAGLVLIVGLHLAALRRQWMRLVVILIALALCVVLVVKINQFWGKARAVPPIHDITTDVHHPPQFQAVIPMRGEKSNPIAYPGPEVAAQQQAAYPDLQPLTVSDSPASAFAAARAVVDELGWEVVAVDPTQGHIESVATTPWFGFKDDVVIRVQARERGSVVDIRSKSRVGVSDVGANAERIRQFSASFGRRTTAL